MIQLKILKEVFAEIWQNIRGLVWFVLIFALILILWGLYRDAVHDNERLSNNQDALLSKAQTYKTESEKNAMSVKTLTITVDELKEHENQLTDKCKELELKLKRVQSITQAGTQSDYNLTGEVRDSIVYVPVKGAYDTLRCSDYCDPYISFTYCVDSSNIYTSDIQTRDTITAIAHRIPKKFLFFRYGTKEIKMEVLSSNPHTNLTTATHVVVEKRWGMKVYEMVSLFRSLLSRMRENGIKVDDLDYIDMYEEYLDMKDRGEKITYIMSLLADKYEVSERTLYRVFAIFSREAK